MYIQSLLYRFRWLHAPAGVMMLLLQRTPVLRLISGGAVNFGVQSGVVLKSAFALGALGAYNSVAGATVFNATVVSPTTVTPTSGRANSTFTASGAQSAAFSVAFSGSGAPSTIKSWKVSGALPAGLTVLGGTAVTGGYTFNGLKVTLSGTPSTSGSSTLTVTAYDSLNASGNNAHVSCIVDLTGGATASPSFTTQPVSQAVTAGTTVTFTSAASGTPTPTLQWFKDGVALTSQTAATLTLTNVQAANAGAYTVTATNSAAPSGVSSNSASLTVAKATATVVLTPSTLSSTYSGTAKTVNATTTPPLLSVVMSYTGTSGTSYGPSTTAPSAAGSYTVTATIDDPNYAGSASGTLVISAKPAQTISFTNPGTKTYGAAPFTLNAKSSSRLPVSYAVASGPAVVKGATVTLTGAGTVVIRASQAGNAKFDAASVDISFTVNALVKAGQGVSLSTPSSLTGQADQVTGYQWRKDGQPIVGATAATLVLSNASTATAGNYDVVVTYQSAPTATSGAMIVQVTPPPAPKIKVQPIAANKGQLGVGETVNLTVTATTASGTLLSYQWRKGGQAVAGATAATLTLSNAAAATAGSYDVVVSNEGGSVTSKAVVLTVMLAPQSLPLASTLRLDGTGTDTPRGAITLNQEWDVAAKTFEDGDATTSETYVYKRITATKASVTYTNTITRSGYTETQKKLLTLTFSDYAADAQTYTGTCVVSGTYTGKNNGNAFKGTLAGGGDFYLVK